MNEETLGWLDEDLNYYFVICVHTNEGMRYAYNHRTLVLDIDFAKKFETRRSAFRCAKLGSFENYELLKLPRPFQK